MKYLEEANNPAWDFYKEFDLAVARIAKTACDSGVRHQHKIQRDSIAAHNQIVAQCWSVAIDLGIELPFYQALQRGGVPCTA